MNLQYIIVFFENSNEGIIVTDSKGRIVSINKAFLKSQVIEKMKL